MKSLFTLTLLLICHFAQSQAVSWHRQYRGSIGKTPYTMHLHRIGDDFRGYYYYDRIQRPIYFTGHDSTAGKEPVTLTAFAPGPAQSYESITLIGYTDTLYGSWKKEQGNSSALEMTGAPVATKDLIFF